jgi:hypothetical protein
MPRQESNIPSKSAGDTLTHAEFNSLNNAFNNNSLYHSKGFVDYNNTGSDISLVADTWTDIPNNAAGSFTNTAYSPDDVGEFDLIDTSNGHLDFTSLTLGSELLIRSDVTVTPGTNNALFELRYLLGDGAGQYPLLFWSERLDSGSGLGYQRVVPFPIYMGDTNTRDNPGRLQAKLSSSGTLYNAGMYISIVDRS